MATLYEINNEILSCFDAETGEILDVERLEALQMEMDAKIENVALWYKNLLSDAAQYKAEKDTFAEREKQAKNKAESLKRYLDNALQGQPFKTIKTNITYRKSEATIIDDIFKIRDDLLKYEEPKPDLTAIKKAIKDGEQIEGAHIEVRNNISIK